MATLIELVQVGELEALEPQLGFRQQPMRMFYARPRVWRWIEQNMPDAECEFGGEIRPLEALDEMLNSFCAGEPLEYERQIRPLHHHGSGVWEIKTRAVRLFGWFHQKDCFVCCSCDFATRVKVHCLYAGYRDEAAAFRERLALDQPKFIEGSDPNGVVTNLSYPKSPRGG